MAPFLCGTGKVWGERAKQQRGRETEYCCERVAEWAINSAIGGNIYDGLETENPRSYQEEHLDIMMVDFLLSATSSYPAANSRYTPYKLLSGCSNSCKLLLPGSSQMPA
jgi:hypothetical protein